MSQQTVWKCNECGTIKKEVNGWWVIDYSDPGSLLISALPSNNIVLRPEELIFCGQACIQHRIAMFLRQVATGGAQETP